MTYTSWAETHLAKRQALQQKLEGYGLDKTQVINYFDFDNMKVAEPDFCPLYKTNTKCHNVAKLNCYLCACPHFKCSDEPLSTSVDGKKTFSVCTANSRFATIFEDGNNLHCNCADCTIPHTTKAALSNYESLSFVEDSDSILTTIRNWQLSDILGKYKLI